MFQKFLSRDLNYQIRYGGRQNATLENQKVTVQIYDRSLATAKSVARSLTPICCKVQATVTICHVCVQQQPELAALCKL